MEGKKIPAKRRCKGPDGQGGSREGKGKEERSKGPDGQGGSREGKEREGKGDSAAAGGGNCLYMFIWNVLDYPNIYSLFAVDIPDEDSSFANPPLLVDGLVMKPNEVLIPPKLPLSPILEFPRTKYPIGMRCVELDSKLYFFGGCWSNRDQDDCFPTNVYIFNPLKMKKIEEMELIMEMMMEMKMEKMEMMEMEMEMEMEKMEMEMEMEKMEKMEMGIEMMMMMEMEMEMMEEIEKMEMMEEMEMEKMERKLEPLKMNKMLEMEMKLERNMKFMDLMGMGMKLEPKSETEIEKIKEVYSWLRMMMLMRMRMTMTIMEMGTETETEMKRIKQQYMRLMRTMRLGINKELLMMMKKIIKEEQEFGRRREPRSFLKVGPNMNTGKSGALPFVFDRKIYVITTSSDFYAPNQSRFEFFDPDAADGYGKWTRLEDPPERGFIYGYTVIDRRAIFLTRNSGIFSFNLDSHEWLKVSQFHPPFVIDSGVFVDDTFFTCSDSFVITSFPPLSSFSSSSASGANGSKQKDETEKLLEFFNNTNMIKLVPGVINTQLQVINRTSSFVHMKGKGNGRRFCHVLLGSPRSPDCPEIECSSICYATITIFDALKDTFTSETRTFLKAKLLYSESFLSQANDEGAFYLINASILPACRAQQIV